MTDWLDTAHATVQYLRYASSTLADMARKLDYCIPNSPAVPELFAIAHTLLFPLDHKTFRKEVVGEECWARLEVRNFNWPTPTNEG